jgi:D-proline reductase (dithiol) PrdB
MPADPTTITPYSYYDLARNQGFDGVTLPDVDFPAPRLTPLRKPIAESTIGLYASCGLYRLGDPPPARTNDFNYRLIDRDIPVTELGMGHLSGVRVWGEQDLNVVYPRDRMIELEAEGVFKRLAPQAVSLVGSISKYTELVETVVPKILAEYERQGVDLVMLMPFCPMCHRSTSVIARALEARGMPTITTSTSWEMTAQYKPPRVAWLDFPLGCSAGRPHAVEQQREILRTLLALVPEFGDPWEIKRLPFTFEPDGSRAWVDEMDRLFLGEAHDVVIKNVADHRKYGDNLQGREQEFVIRCNC